MSIKIYHERLSELTWDEVRKDVHKINPDFAKNVDSVSPDSKHTIFKARYYYGDEILKRAKFYLPSQGDDLIAIDDLSLPAHIRESLGYNLGSNPVMMILNNALEWFLPLEDRIIPPSNLVVPGRIFGTYRILVGDRLMLSHHPAFIWDMTAGACSIFMLAKISDAEKYKKLRKIFALHFDKPKYFLDQWRIFKALACQQTVSNRWYVDVLFFSKKWFEHLNDKKWLPLNYFLYQNAWKRNDFWNNVFFWDLIFLLIQKEVKLKPSAYVADTVKHILTISVGEALGYVPAVDDTVAPINLLQKIYSDVYNIRHAPIIMQPGVVSLSVMSRPVYYSLHIPTAMGLGGKARTRDNFTNDLFEVKSLLIQYVNKILSNQFNLAHTPFYEYLGKISYAYIHNECPSLLHLKKSTDVCATDPSFLETCYCKNKPFPHSSSFFNGCIKISYKN